MLSITIDTKALLDSAVVGLGGALVLTLAFSVAVLAYDRSRTDAQDGGEGGAASSLVWSGVAAIGGLVCIGIIALGVWAMTQK